MTEPIRIVEGSWTHTCLRSGREGETVKLHLPGGGGCPHCGDPGPEKQPVIDAQSATRLHCPHTNTALEFRTVASDWGEPHPPEAVEVCLDCGAEIIEDHPIPF